MRKGRIRDSKNSIEASPDWAVRRGFILTSNHRMNNARHGPLRSRLGPKRDFKRRDIDHCLPEPVNPRQPQNRVVAQIGGGRIGSIENVDRKGDGFASLGLSYF